MQRGRDALASLGSSLRVTLGTAPATGHNSAPAASGTHSAHTGSRGDGGLPTASPCTIAQGALPSDALAGGDAEVVAATQLPPPTEPADPTQSPGLPDSPAAAAAAAEHGSDGEGAVLQPFTLTFSGLSTFRDRVSYHRWPDKSPRGPCPMCCWANLPAHTLLSAVSKDDHETGVALMSF